MVLLRGGKEFCRAAGWGEAGGALRVRRLRRRCAATSVGMTDLFLRREDFAGEGKSVLALLEVYEMAGPEVESGVRTGMPSRMLYWWRQEVQAREGLSAAALSVAFPVSVSGPRQ